MPPRLRFAPSPSGYLHIGGARTALFNWLWAKKQGGRFVLRIEDTDQDRSSLESVRAILESLRWLGLDWDEGPEVGGDCGPYFQSERRGRYRQLADELVEAGKAYRCYATKEELDAARAALKAQDPKAQFVYPGWWRDKGPADWLEGRPFVYRFRTPAEGSARFEDEVFGVVETPNSAQQDFVLMRSDGFPLYNFSCVADDHDMRISLVGRGRDHLGNTAQQVLLYEALGWEPPRFAHLPMMLSPKGEKLSKRHAAVGVMDYAARGMTPMGVLNYLARFGWSHGDQEIFSRGELIEAFDWKSCGRSDGKFDEKKFSDVAFEHLKEPRLTSDEDYAAWVRPFLAENGLTDEQVPEGTLRAALPTIRERARTLVEAAVALDYYFREPPVVEEKARSKFLTPAHAPLLAQLRQVYEGAPRWTAEALEARLAEQGLEVKLAAQPLRVALTGRTATPPIFDVMAVLGRERTLARLGRGAELAAG